MSSMLTDELLTPFANCPALDGCHCWSNSLMKIYHHYGFQHSEEMLFGLGAGLGFIYWEQKGAPPFIGGRGNVNGFLKDIGDRTGVKVTERSTTSQRKAEKSLLDQMSKEEPLMIRVDMGFMPYFDFGSEDYHFGSHTAVICGYDGQERVLASDISQSDRGLKRGFYAPLTLEQLGQARGSTYKPFPPKNTYFEFDFRSAHEPGQEAVRAAVGQVCEAMINPPIRNLGIKGIRRTAKEIMSWPRRFDKETVRRNLFMLFVMIEIGGTGGGLFRPLYARFLNEAAPVLGSESLNQAARSLYESGARFTELALLFENVLEESMVSEERINRAAEMLVGIADLEEVVFTSLRRVVW